MGQLAWDSSLSTVNIGLFPKLEGTEHVNMALNVKFFRNYSSFALQMVLNHKNLPTQEEIYRKMIKKPVQDQPHFEKVWKQVIDLENCYRMSE